MIGLKAPLRTCFLTLLTGVVLSSGIQESRAQSPTLVVDASTGQVISAEDATRPWNPASTTKMMTAYVALRAVKSGMLTIDTPLIASANAARQKPSKLGIRPGQEITLDNALKILMVKSANDIAVVIAEAIGGSIPGFANMMNAEARRLGMNESRFLNPHGFHADGHQSSARDLAILAMATLRDFPEYREYWGIGAVQAGNRLMYNTNGLIGRYSGATGFKTGFVCASGFNLVAMANRGGRTLITVVLGASSGGERVVRSAQLLDQGFNSWGGNGYTLASLPASGYQSAPNMRGQICSGRRGVVLADDSDYGGSILSDSHSGDSMAAGSPLAFMAMQNSTNSASRGVRSSAGRSILGPRTGITPVAIYYGRAPGSTAVAMGPGGRRTQPASAASETSASVPGLPAAASALAPAARNSQQREAIPGIASPTPAQQATIRPAASSSGQRQETGDRAAAGAPLQLPGVVTTAPKAGAIGAMRSNPKAEAGADRKTAPVAKKQAAADKKTDPRSKAENSKKQPPKKQPPKKKPVEDDE